MLERVRDRLFAGPTIGEKLEQFSASHRPLGVRSKSFEDKIEVIVPCYNHAEYLPDAIASVRGQTWTDHRITLTLIDDASTDATPDVIAAVVDMPQARVKHLRNSANLRQWGSLNRAIAVSTNELMVILNDDDMLVPDALDTIVATLRDNPAIYMVGGSSTWFDAESKREHQPAPLTDLELTVYDPAGTRLYRELNDLNLTHSSTAFFKVAWESVGGYRPKEKRVHRRAAEDRDFQMRVNSLFPVGVYTDYPLAFWRIDTSHGHEY